MHVMHVQYDPLTFWTFVYFLHLTCTAGKKAAGTHVFLRLDCLVYTVLLDRVIDILSR